MKGKSPDGSNRQRNGLNLRNKAVILCSPPELGEFVTSYWGGRRG